MLYNLGFYTITSNITTVENKIKENEWSLRIISHLNEHALSLSGKGQTMLMGSSVSCDVNLIYSRSNMVWDHADPIQILAVAEHLKYSPLYELLNKYN